MDRRVLAFVALLMLVFIFINEVYHTTKFIIKYHNVKETAKLNRMSCDNLHTEAETERFQICTSIYDLLMPNDSFNCKTYIIFVLIFAIILFLYVADAYVSYLYDNFENNRELTIYIGLILLHFITFLITNIALRYAPYDEQGYLNSYKYPNYGYNNDPKNENANNERVNSNMVAYYSTLWGIPVAINIIILYFIKFKIGSWVNNIGYYLFYFACYYLALHFLFLLIVIVEAFKTNTVPWDLASTQNDPHKYWTADISYDSENYFYYNYMKLNDLKPGKTPWIFDNPVTINNDGNYKNWQHPLNYAIHSSFIAKNLRLHNIILIACIIFVILCIFIFFVICYNKFFSNNLGTFSKIMNDKIIPICYPILVLFILLFVIIYTTDYNTAINKHILLDRNAVYKYDLCKLNNVATPYIYMYNNYTEANKERQNYLYNYIVFNVLISYFTNYINVFSNNYVGNPATHPYLSEMNSYFKDETYFSNNNKLFSMINDNDIMNENKFKEYYSKVFDLIFEKEIPTNLNKKDIEDNYVKPILANIFGGDTTKLNVSDLDDVKGLKISDEQDATKDELILTAGKDDNGETKIISNISTFKSYTGDKITQIKRDIYRLFQIFEGFNDKIGDYNNIVTNTHRTKLLEYLQFYVQDDEKDNNCIPYRFILKKTFSNGQNDFGKLSDEDYNKYENKYGTIIKRTINVFILHILSLYQDYNNLINQSDNNIYIQTFNVNVVATFNVMRDTQSVDVKKYNNDKLPYLYYALNNFKVDMQTNENYLKYLITNNAYKLTDEKYDIKLIDNKKDGNDLLANIDDELKDANIAKYANGSQLSKIYETYTNEFLKYNDKKNGHPAIHKQACKTASDIWQIYIIDMILIYIVYKLL